MVFLLSNRNIFNYLAQLNLIEGPAVQENEQNLNQVETRICKNFNLLVRLSQGQDLLVKQEPHDRQGETKGDLWHEWRVHQLLQTHADLQPLLKWVSEIIHFDPDHAVIVARYLSDYCDLDQFYTQHRIFPSILAAIVGRILANVHRATLDRSEYQSFLAEDESFSERTDLPLKNNPADELTPEVFGQVSAEGLKFYSLYQRYESLHQAIDQLLQSQEPCCLTHQDLKFNNILLHQSWLYPDSELAAAKNGNSSSDHHLPSPIRLIDWEKWAWGEPAADLGMLVAGYLKIWLKSLRLRSGIDINQALQWAEIPLDQLQPSIVALVQAYCTTFPEVLSRFPQFLWRVMQFTGFALIESLQAKIYYREPFGNIEIGLLQVAKTLLCAPESSIATVFGISAAELLAPELITPELPASGQDIRVDKACLEKMTLKLQAELQAAMRSILPQQETDRAQKTGSAGLSRLLRTDCPPLTCTQAQMLQDLVQQIQIRSDGVSHPHFPQLEGEQAQGIRVHQLPPELRQHHLRTQLCHLLYDLYFSGELRIAAMLQGAAVLIKNQPIKNQPFENLLIENNMVGGLNLQFFDQIERNNSGTGYWDGGWQVLRQLKDRYAVRKAELTIFVEPHHLRPENRSPQLGDVIEILLPHHRMEGEFYVAIGNAGMVPDDRPTLEICFHVSPIGALTLMRYLTVELNQRQLPFTFKMMNDPEAGGRYDAAVLSLECVHYSILRQILQPFYREHRSQFYPTVPLLMKPIAPGIGLAEEPEAETFGMHRCQLIADALFDRLEQERLEQERLEQERLEQECDREETEKKESHKTLPGHLAEKRFAAIRKRLLEQGISWQYPYLNPRLDSSEDDQEDSYAPLDI